MLILSLSTIVSLIYDTLSVALEVKVAECQKDMIGLCHFLPYLIKHLTLFDTSAKYIDSQP